MPRAVVGAGHRRGPFLVEQLQGSWEDRAPKTERTWDSQPSEHKKGLLTNVKVFQKEKIARKLLRKEGILPEITDTLRSTWRAGASRGPGTMGEPAGHTPWSPQPSVVDGTSNTSSGYRIFSRAGLNHRCPRCRTEKAAGHAPSSSSYSAMAPARRQHQGGGRGRLQGQLARNSPFTPFIQAMITCPPLTLKNAR